MSNLNRTGPYLEAMALSRIVEDMMQDGAVITYSNDGSSRSRVGAYLVQSLTINGKQRVLPTFGLISESRDTLKDLEITTAKILAAASGNKYSPSEIVGRINFVVTDSTAHNLGVIEQVCEELEVEQVPKTLLCNAHPILMFQNKTVQLFKVKE